MYADAMLMRREASTPRRSRGVLVLSPSQHCARVGEVRLRYCSIYIRVELCENLKLISKEPSRNKKIVVMKVLGAKKLASDGN